MLYIDVKIITWETYNIIRIPSNKKEKLIKSLENYFGAKALLKSGETSGVYIQRYSIGDASVYFTDVFCEK